MGGFQGLGGIGNADGFLDGTFQPADLTASYPYQQIFFPASIMSLQSNQEPIFQTIQIGAQTKNLDVITFAPGVAQGVNWVHAFKENELDVAAPNFKMKGLWFQSVDTPDPADVVDWEYYIHNALIATTLNDALPGGDHQLTPTEDQWVIASGTAGDQEESEPLTVTGDALSATNTNILTFAVERHGDTIDDDYLGSVHLLGVMLQWKTNFANILEWPVP